MFIICFCSKIHTSHQVTIHSLDSLREIDLSYNKLSHVPLFEPRSNLESLVLSNNKIEKLAENLDESYVSLRTLDISHNILKALPLHVIKLSLHHLEDLLIGSNLLESIPPFPVKEDKFVLRKLDMKGNMISFEDVKELVHLEMDGKIHLCHFLETVPQSLDGGLYLGSAAAARNLAVLKKLNITHILNAAEPREVFFSDELSYLTLGLSDTADQDLLPALPKAHEFIEEAVSGNGGGVLIHCQAGVSRSVAIAASYLMKTRKITCEKAISLIQSKRIQARPIAHFVKCLESYENEILVE